MGRYYRPQALQDALQILSDRRVSILAGGTDFYPARVGRVIDDDIIDIAAIDGLRGIEEVADGWRIGATTTWSDVVESELPPLFDGLKLAAREVGGRQIQNTGTVAGNLCNASPAADGMPALLSLGARVELASAAGTRFVMLEDFVLGNRRTVLRPGEMLTALHIGRPAATARSHFLKLGARRYLVISIVMVAGVLTVDDGNVVRTARIAIGSCSEVAQRLPALEAALVGRPADERLTAALRRAHLRALSPIDDCRGSASYRLDTSLTLVRRLLGQLAEGVV